MRGLSVMLVIAAGCGGNANMPGDDEPVTDGPGSTDGDGSQGDGPSTTGDAPPDPCAPDTWCTEDAPASNTLLRAVWAANLNDVFAVGDGGAIFHRRDNAWTSMISGTTENLRGVFGISASDLWAAGNNGTLLHYDGSMWTAKGSFTSDLHGIWASATDDVWITTVGGVIHWNGQAFSTTSLPGTVFSISGTGPNDVWATGEQAKVDHFTGTWATGIDPGAGATYFAVLALPGEAWVSTFSTMGKQTLRFAAGSWTPKAAPGTTFQGFHGISGSDIWAAGQDDVGHYDGATWTVEQPAGAVQMFGIGGVGSSFWIVGSNSLILHRR